MLLGPSDVPEMLLGPSDVPISDAAHIPTWAYAYSLIRNPTPPRQHLSKTPEEVVLRPEFRLFRKNVGRGKVTPSQKTPALQRPSEEFTPVDGQGPQETLHTTSDLFGTSKDPCSVLHGRYFPWAKFTSLRGKIKIMAD